MPVLWERIKEGVTNENEVNFVGLYAGVMNMFWKKEEGRRTYVPMLHQSLEQSVHILVEGPTFSPSMVMFPLKTLCLLGFTDGPQRGRGHNDDRQGKFGTIVVYLVHIGDVVAGDGR